MMKDLIQKIDNLILEAEVKPGERKEISFRINKLEKLKKKLEEYRRSLGSISYAALPPELEAEREELQKKLNLFVSKVEVEYDELYRKYHGDAGTPIKLEKLLNGIKKNCGQIVKVYQQINGENFTNERFIYRGIRSSEDALYGKPFTERRPKDSYSNMDKLADDALKNAGYEARRTNSIFTSGSYSQASNYGSNVYIIFPVDDFYFTYSKRIGDLVLNNEYMQYFVDQDTKKEIVELVKEYWEKEPEGGRIRSQYYSKEGIDESLLSRSYSYNDDIQMLKRWVENGTLPEKAGKLLDKVLSNDKGFLEHMEFVDDDIYKAILSEHEIYINSAYYAIKKTFMPEIIKFLKNVDTSDVEMPERFGEEPGYIYSKGDIVQFIAGEYEGKLGVVDNAGIDKLSVIITYDNGTIYGVEPETVTLVDNQDDYKFKEDERVIVTNEDSPYYGHSGSIYDNWGTNVKVTIDQVGVRKYFAPTELVRETPELIDYYKDKKKKTFSKWEKVVVIDKNSAFYNYTGVVSALGSSGHVEVKLDGSEVHISMDPKDLMLLSEYTGTPKTPISRNDRVIIKNYVPELNDKIGIATNFYSDGDVTVKIGNNERYINLKYIELVGDEDISETDKEVKVGDVVRITSTQLSSYGEMGIVEKFDYDSSIDKDDPILEIHRLYKDPAYARLSGVKKIYVRDRNDNVLSVGENVKLVSPAYGTALDGGIFKLARFYISDSGLTHVVIADNKGEETRVKSTALEKTTDLPAKFNVGDKVTVIGSTNLKGEKGKVVKTVTIDGKNYANVELETVSNEILTFEEDELELTGSEPLEVGDVAHVKGTNDYVKVISIPSPTTIEIKHVNGKVDLYAKNELKKIASTDQLPFRVGQSVRITSDVNFDEVGKIKNIDLINGFVYVSISVGDDGITYDYDPSEFEVIVEPIFKDDKVVVINNDSEHFGKEGTVDFVWSSGTVDVVDPITNVEFSVDSLKDLMKIDKFSTSPSSPSQDDTKLKVGDKVKNIKVGHPYFGVTGEVKTIYGSGNIGLVYSDGEQAIDPPANLEKISSEQSGSETTLKIGDKVKILEPGNSYDGHVGKITVGPDSDGDFIVTFDDGSESYYAPADLEKVEEPKTTTKFSVGDKVKATGPSAYNVDTYEGSVGTIETLSNDKKFASVKFTEYDILTYSVDNIEKLNTATTNSGINTGDIVSITGSSLVSDNTLALVIDGKNNVVSILEGGLHGKSFTIPDENMTIIPDYKIGDTVKVINPDLSFEGKVGVIEQIDGVMVKIVGEDFVHGFTIVKETSIKRVDIDDQETEKDATTLKVGDNVKINYPNSPIDGKVGIIQYVGTQYADVVVPPAPDHDPYVVPLENLVKTNSEVPPAEQLEKFEADDIVEVINPGYTEYHGKKFRVSFVTDDGTVALIKPVDNPEHQGFAFGIEDLKKIS